MPQARDGARPKARGEVDSCRAGEPYAGER